MMKFFSFFLFFIIVIAGGTYLFFQYKDGQKILLNKETQQIEENSPSAQKIVNLDDWQEYIYANSKINFQTKYPQKDWKVLEQNSNNELSIIFTNVNNCQLVYTFDIENEKYNFDIINNENNKECAEILSKIVAYSSIPSFVLSDINNNSEDKIDKIIDNNNEEKEENTIDKKDENSDADLSVNDDNENLEEEKNEEEDNEEENIEVNDSNSNEELSTADIDNKLEEMTAEERYQTAKEFVHNYLTEYAKRHWDIVKASLSRKALQSLGSDNLEDKITKYYYYELITVLKEKSLGNFQVSVKLTDKDDNPIGSGDGIYLLNIVWEDGAWKIDNYIFD